MEDNKNPFLEEEKKENENIEETSTEENIETQEEVKEKQKDDFEAKYEKYEECENAWKKWEEEQLENLNNYNNREQRKQELYFTISQLKQNWNNLTKQENFYRRNEQFFYKLDFLDLDHNL